MREILAALDIGSSTIKLVVAEVLNGKINVLCALDEESRGVKKGAIYEAEETGYAIKKLLIRAEEMLGVKLSKAIVSVNEDSADFKIGEGSIEIEASDKEILSSDIIKAIQASANNTELPKGNEIVTVIPIMFKVGEKKTRKPKGMKGSKLSARTVIISVPKREILSVAKCLESDGIEVVDVIIPSIGSYFAHKTDATDSETGIVVDCGGETIKIGVFNKGIIVNNLVLGLGGKNVDNDISFIYKVTPEESKKLKETLALANKRYANPRITETVVDTLGEKKTIDQAEISEIVMSRLHEILNMAKNEINYLTKKEISYIILTGGLTEFKDFSLEIESIFGNNAEKGKIEIVGARNNKFATSIGMIKYFDSKLKMRDREFSIFSSDEIDLLTGETEKKTVSGDSILGKVFGLFFDN